MATITTLTSSGGWHPDLVTIAASTAVPDALILSTSTVAGNVEGDAEFVRAIYADDAAATLTPEGQPIAESDPDLTEALVYTTKVTTLVPISREQFSQPNAPQMLSESVTRAVTARGNIAYIQQAAPAAGTSTPPAGLAALAGTEAPDVVDNLDPLVDLQATIASLDGNPTHWILSPTAWAGIRKIKRQTGSAESLLGVGAADAQPYLLDVPVLVSNAVPANTGLLVDKTAIISAVGQVMVAQSEHALFSADSIMLRATWRLGQNVVHPERLGSFTVAPAA